MITHSTVKEMVVSCEQKPKSLRVGKNKKTKSMKTKVSHLALAFCFLGLTPVKTLAFNYTITFTGTGASSTVNTVIVQNLTKGTSVTVPTGNVLNLSDAATAIEQLDANDETIRVYPASVEGKSMVKSGMIKTPINERNVNFRDQSLMDS